MSGDKLLPRESGKYIAENSTHITINQANCERLGKEILDAFKNKELSVNNFSQVECHPRAEDSRAPDWIFVLDTLNFCFWKHLNSPDGWKVQGNTGYMALCAAIRRAINEGIAIHDPKYYAKITMEDLEKVMRGDTKATIPLMHDRLKNLHEVGNVLLSKYNGSFKNVIAKANKSASQLLNIIVEDFPCFRDEAKFKGKTVTFYKRAQILIGDIWACFKGEDLGEFSDISALTVFADYRVPQVLLYYGALKYDRFAMDTLKKGDVLQKNDDLELEIRGCTIHAAEKILESMRAKPPNLNAVLVDHYLWDYRRKNNKEIEAMKIPFHRVFSTYY